jgi:hypothetical protein
MRSRSWLCSTCGTLATLPSRSGALHEMWRYYRLRSYRAVRRGWRYRAFSGRFTRMTGRAACRQLEPPGT